MHAYVSCWSVGVSYDDDTEKEFTRYRKQFLLYGCMSARQRRDNTAAAAAVLSFCFLIMCLCRKLML